MYKYECVCMGLCIHMYTRAQRVLIIHVCIEKSNPEKLHNFNRILLHVIILNVSKLFIHRICWLSSIQHSVCSCQFFIRKWKKLSVRCKRSSRNFFSKKIWETAYRINVTKNECSIRTRSSHLFIRNCSEDITTDDIFFLLQIMTLLGFLGWLSW